MALTTRVALQVTASQSSALDLVTAAAPLDFTFRDALATGTGADQADLVWSDTRTLAASATEDLDLAGVLTGALGSTLTFARVKAVVISAAAGNTNDVQVTTPAANGFPLFLAASDGIAVKPGGVVFVFSPGATSYAVTAGTGDLLTVTNSGAGTAVTYSIIVIGASA